MKVFIDSDIILDILQKRQGYEYALKIIEHVENREILAYTSAIVLTNIFYIASKQEGKVRAMMAIKKIRKAIRIVDINEKIVDQAIDSEFKDFEDALQYFSAVKFKCDYLVTRNLKDYVIDKIKVVTPKELIPFLESN